MKNFLLVLVHFFLLASTILRAEEETTSLSDLIKGKSPFAGYTGAHFILAGKQTEFLDQKGYLANARFGCSFYNSFMFGVFGNTLVSDVQYEDTTYKQELDYDITYYGGYIGWNFFGRKLANFSLLTDFGYGTQKIEKLKGKEDPTRHASDDVLVIEPNLLAEIFITKNFRLGAGYSYRYVQNQDYEELSKDDVNGSSIMVTFNIIENFSPRAEEKLANNTSPAP